ncbi:MAG: hypothetical protein OCC45_04175 [Desulfotalea sp.]
MEVASHSTAIPTPNTAIFCDTELLAAMLHLHQDLGCELVHKNGSVLLYISVIPTKQKKKHDNRQARNKSDKEKYRLHNIDPR